MWQLSAVCCARDGMVTGHRSSCTHRAACNGSMQALRHATRMLGGLWYTVFYLPFARLFHAFYLHPVVVPTPKICLPQVAEPQRAPIVLPGHRMEVTGAAWCPSGSIAAGSERGSVGQVATCSDDATVRLWTIRRGEGGRLRERRQEAAAPAVLLAVCSNVGAAGAAAGVGVQLGPSPGRLPGNAVATGTEPPG